MTSRFSPLWSTVGRKFLMAVTGLGWFGFVVMHLLGNLLLLSGNRDLFNRYAHGLTSLGALLVTAELVLLGSLLIHASCAVWVTWDGWKARPVSYCRVVTKGKPSRKTLSSSTMIWTGLVLAVFIPLHVYTLKYGPGIEQGYVTMLDGQPVRDLRRLVVETFSHAGYALGYVAVMGFLGFHLRHGFWSAIQSLGAYHPRLTPVAYGLGYLAAAALAVGFIFIPAWIYFGGGAA